MGFHLGHMRGSGGGSDGGHGERCTSWCMALGRVDRESLSQCPFCGSGDRALLLGPAVPMKPPFQPLLNGRSVPPGQPAQTPSLCLSLLVSRVPKYATGRLSGTKRVAERRAAFTFHRGADSWGHLEVQLIH